LLASLRVLLVEPHGLAWRIEIHDPQVDEPLLAGAGLISGAHQQQVEDWVVAARADDDEQLLQLIALERSSAPRLVTGNLEHVCRGGLDGQAPLLVDPCVQGSGRPNEVLLGTGALGVDWPTPLLLASAIALDERL
jgi:hypothetical protein